MKVIIHDSTDKLDPKSWDSLIGPYDLFHKFSVLVDLEKSQIEESQLFYLLVKSKKNLIASAVLCDFPLHLDLFAGNSKWVKFLKGAFPKIFTTRVLFCGTPISAGQKNIFKSPEYTWKEILPLINEHLESFARDRNINICIYKEFLSGEVSLEEELKKQNYFQAFSLPNVQMSLPFQGTDDYLKALRHNYRRQIRASLKKLETHRPIFVDNYFVTNYREERPVFTFLSPSSSNINDFYSNYLSVMERAEVKLETINLEFFKQFLANQSHHIHLLAMVYEGKILGMFLLYDAVDTLIFLWTAKETQKSPHDVYQNLLTATVFWAIENQFQSLVLGQTSYYPKMRMGGKVEPLYIYCKSLNRWKNYLFRGLNTLIFPPTKVPKLQTFKTA